MNSLDEQTKKKMLESYEQWSNCLQKNRSLI